ncbi:hypothetical protein NDU88_002554 [Pleurodeles waltl]|uniref:Uncharacterized protein n=1 Tax=Pleurodeles waltl TaxID=8319 RepID=A0AAV7MP59_PLEWA|nr:hypothetical protein NDU88_002554 [Pleurodeles waltl]
MTSVRIDEHAGVRTPEKKDASKQSQQREKGGNWREKLRRDRIDKSKNHTDGVTSNEESIFGDPRNEQKDKGNPGRVDKESRTGGWSSNKHRDYTPDTILCVFLLQYCMETFSVLNKCHS